MKVVIITQDDLIYLPSTINDLIDSLSVDHEVVCAVVLSASPFGKKETFFSKAVRTFTIFGIKFFIYYSFQFLYQKIRNVSVSKVLANKQISTLNLDGSINKKSNIKKLVATDADILISVTANEIFKPELFNRFKYGCINLHTALLPKYRGLMPSFWVLKNNENFTGVSVFQVDSGIDSGPIIQQERVEIGSMSQRELISITKKVGVRLIVNAVNELEKGTARMINNSDDDASYFGMPERSDVKEFYANGKRFF